VGTGGQQAMVVNGGACHGYQYQSVLRQALTLAPIQVSARTPLEFSGINCADVGHAPHTRCIDVQLDAVAVGILETERLGDS
jgi:hypothetical protein